MKAFLKFILFFFKDPEYVHNFILKSLRVLGKFPLLCRLISKYAAVNDNRLSQNIWGLEFKNPIGLAAGVDKNGSAIQGIQSFGFGFLEIGTISFQEQSGNPRQRLFTLPDDEAVINRMGFNSVGSAKAAEFLSKQKALVPIGLSIGKSKITPLEDAAKDYAGSYNRLYPYADYFAINISSPNTPGLRELQDKDLLRNLIRTLQAEREKITKEKNLKKSPIIVKIAPDLTFEAIKEALLVCREEKVDGIIATNTTITREWLKNDPNETGGLSGKPLKDRATEIISFVHKEVPEIPIIGVGGIFSAEDAYEKLKAGASLLQIYTGLVYEGPFLARKINRGLLKILKKNNLDSLTQIKSC